MNIRRAQSGDADKLLPLASDLATSFVVDPAIFREAFHQCLQDENSIVLVAEHESSLVGYLLGFDHVAFFANGRVSGVEELYVIPQQRRRGIGRALMVEFEKWALSWSAHGVLLSSTQPSDMKKQRPASGMY